MTKPRKVQYFESEGRENLLLVIKNIKAFLRPPDDQEVSLPNKIVFMTREGEGPMLAHSQLQAENLKIIAVTFPRHYTGRRPDNSVFMPEISEKVQRFFKAFDIPIVTNRLPFDDINGAESHNREMALLRSALALFGGSIPLAIQAVLQAADAGYVEVGERVIAATGDTALLVTASTTRLFLEKDSRGLSVNEIICKPRVLNMTRKPHLPQLPTTANPVSQIEGRLSSGVKPEHEETT
jgi:hypothetical protein